VIILDKAIGKVIHYYKKINVAIIDLQSGTIKIGDKLKFKKGEEEFTQEVTSIQIEHKVVEEVKKGDEFGLKVDQKVEEGTEVFKVLLV
jgi:translation initiation factor IF-2